MSFSVPAGKMDALELICPSCWTGSGQWGGGLSVTPGVVFTQLVAREATRALRLFYLKTAQLHVEQNLQGRCEKLSTKSYNCLLKTKGFELMAGLLLFS